MDGNKIKACDIIIVPNKPEYYEHSVQVYNDSFLPKFSFVSKDLDKQKTFVDDFGVVNMTAKDKEFVALIGDEVVGILSLTYREQGKVKFIPNLSDKDLFKKYGLLGIVKASLFGLAVSYKPPKGELYIDNIGVSKDSRGLGIGSAMLQFCQEFAMNKGLEKISLQVVKENVRAKALYETFGYKTISYKPSKWLKKATGYSGSFKMIKEIKVV